MEKERLNTIVRQTFDLTKTEASIVLYLNEHKKTFSIVELVDVFNKDRTTITKAIINIVKKSKDIKNIELIKQYQINLTRGFRYEYAFNKDCDLHKLLVKEVNKSANNDKDIISKLL